ncbi:MAG: CHASE2 domain-containing protein [Oligoflexia bacterium]|nr:CHASE2 domain-containing protein [Oligoflexia bacterium]
MKHNINISKMITFFLRLIPKTSNNPSGNNKELSCYYPLFFTLLFTVILIQYNFPSMEAFFYDLRAKYDFGIDFEDNIVLVTLDDESDAHLGEKAPYTYATHVQFLKKLFTVNSEPTVVSFLVSLHEPESEIESSAQEKFKNLVLNYKTRGGKFRFGNIMMEGFGEQWPPLALRELGHSLALLHIDSVVFSKDEVCRRAILNISGDDSIHLWTANQYREKIGLSALNVNNIQGATYSPQADATFVLFRYYTEPYTQKINTQSSNYVHNIHSKKIKRISYHQVIAGHYPEKFFANKIVVVGTQYFTKQSDLVLTPFNRTHEKMVVPSVNIHAEIIESLVQNKTIWPLPRSVTNVICFILAIFLSYINSRISPSRGVVIIIATALGIFLISIYLFSFHGIWPYITHLILTIFVVYYIWVPFRAIAEYQQRYAIEEESKLLKEVDCLKQNFISLMSHDLKTPVARIAGNAEILAKYYQSDEKQKKHLKNILDATKELNNFITGILDFIRVESQRCNLNLVPKDINTIVEEVSLNYHCEAEQQSMNIELDLSPLYPIKVDVILLKRVISNIVENAIKYSGKEKKIVIRTWDDEHWVYIKISDNGVGISQENLEHIFDKFFRIKNDAAHTIKGFGLGLYLVKYFVELHGGKIGVNSTPGVGTEFLITLKNC